MIDFKRIRKEKKMTQTEFAKLIGVSLRSVQSYEKGDTKPSADVLMKIMQLDMNNDSYLKNDAIDIAKEPEAIWVNYERFMLVPMVSHRAQAGFLSGWGDDEYLEELPKVPWEVDKEYKGKYMTFEVSGESMESEEDPRDSLYEGDLLLCREVMLQHWQNKLHINKWDFVIVHREKGILAKRITHHDTNNGIITLHSLNPYYEDQKVRLDDLIAIFNIIDVKRSRKRR
jgi:transcriptional regulator with XRE-family HTH domain